MSQFDTCMDFLVKFLSKIHHHNQFSHKKISPTTCVAHLKEAISDNEMLNTEMACIEVDQKANPGNTKSNK